MPHLSGAPPIILCEFLFFFSQVLTLIIIRDLSYIFETKTNMHILNYTIYKYLIHDILNATSQQNLLTNAKNVIMLPGRMECASYCCDNNLLNSL